MVFNTNDQWIGRSLDLYGEYSEGEVDLFRKVINPGDTVIDIGANIGALTVPLSRLVGPSGRVFAFEPQHLMYYTLCANVAINNILNTDCWLMALGKEKGSIRVPVLDMTRPGNYGGLEINKEHDKAAIFKTVPKTTLDSATLSTCQFIKIDVEGMELEIIEGAVETINKFQPYLYVEDDRKEQTEALHKKIFSLGYRIFQHRPFLFNLNNFYNKRENEFLLGDKPVASLNLICVPDQSVVPDHTLREILEPRTDN